MDGERPPSEPHLVMGSIVHEVADLYVFHLMDDGGGSDFDRLDKIAAEVWDSPERLGLTEYHKEEYLMLVDKIKEQLVFGDISEVQKSEMKVAVNAAWEPCAYDAPDAFVRGRIDRVDQDADGNLTITDYKTGRRIDPVEGSNQLRLYARMARAYWPEAPSITVVLHYLRFGIKRSLTIEDGDMEKGREWIEAVGRNIEKSRVSGYWPATPGQACRGCSIFKNCEARKRTGKITPPGDDAEAYALVERLIIIERERTEIREALNGFVDAFGSIEVNGMVLGLFPKYSVDWDVRQVADILERHGLRAYDYLRVDTVALKKAVRRDQSLQADLDAVKSDSSTTALELKRSVEEFVPLGEI